MVGSISTLGVRDNRIVPDWRVMADLVWQGMTVPDACAEMGIEWPKTYSAMPEEVRRYMVDVSMLAGCRDKYLGGQE